MEPIGDPAKRLTASAQHLTTSSQGSKAAMELALYHSKLILGCYRADDVSDPQVYVTAIAAVLSRYPADIGVRLSDPKEGIAGRLKWLPTVSEIKTACDELQAADLAAAKRKADLAEQWRLRDQFEEWFPQARPDPYNVFVPTFAPQYAAMVERGGRPGFSVEDKTRPGVWVPHSWFNAERSQQRWRPYTAEDLLAKYPPKQATE